MLREPRVRETSKRSDVEEPKKDGRRERSVRTHRAIVTALLELVDEGSFEPTALEIANRAGVALRSIRQHFATREELFVAAVTAHAARVSPARDYVDARMSLVERIAAFAEVRARELEISSPIRRAAAFLDGQSEKARASSSIGRAVEAAWQRRRREAGHVFSKELAQADDKKALLDTIDVLGHGRTWDTMRFTMGMSYADATASLRRTLAGVLR